MFLSPSPESLADSLETSTRDDGDGEEAKKKGPKEGSSLAGPSRRPEEGGDRPHPGAQVSLSKPEPFQ